MKAINLSRDMETWTDTELANVINKPTDEWYMKGKPFLGDSTTYSNDAMWSTCLQGVRCGGDAELARQINKASEFEQYKHLRHTDHELTFIYIFSIASYYDLLCHRFGGERVINAIKSHAVNVLVERCLYKAYAEVMMES